MAPLVLHQEEEGEDGGEKDQDDADHHHQAAVEQPAEETGLVTILADHYYNYDGCLIYYNYNYYISIFLMLITRGC